MYNLKSHMAARMVAIHNTQILLWYDRPATATQSQFYGYSKHGELLPYVHFGQPIGFIYVALFCSSSNN